MRLSLPSILVAFLLGVFLPGFASVALGANFEFQDGDRVVLVGDTLIEREQLYGYIEQRLTVEFPNRNVTFRNLGWSADTPAGESRASFDFDKPGKGLQKLKDQLAAIRPTVVILGYGMASSLAGSTNSQPRSSEFQGGVAHFKADVMRLIDDI